MNGQLSFSEAGKHYSEDDIAKLLENIIKEEELPEESLYLYVNLSQQGENKGKEISKSICIYEPEFPPTKNKKVTRGKNLVVLNIQHQKDEYELLIRDAQFERITLPSSAKIKPLKSDKAFKHVIFKKISSDMIAYIKSNVLFCLDTYTSSSSFGCCARFMACSDAKKCVHPNKLYAKGCKYRRNLDAGRIFYGKNRNT